MAFTSVDVSIEDIQTSLKIPRGYVVQVLCGLFGLSATNPLPDLYRFFKIEDVGITNRKIYNSPESVMIGLFQNEVPLEKAAIIEYITQSAPDIVDITPWEDVTVYPYPGAEPEYVEPVHTVDDPDVDPQDA